METLHDMQREQPELFADSKFRIGVKGEQERSRLKYFGSYTGPDPETLRTLEVNCQAWFADPRSFWENPKHLAIGTSTPGELVAFYINAKSDDS